MVTQEQLRKGFVLGEWRIWPNAGQIEKDGVSHHVEPKLVEVLLYLAESHGQVVGREEMLNRVWHKQVVCDEAFTRTVSELRTLLGDGARERRYICTVPKRGYSLVDELNLITDDVNTSANLPNGIPQTQNFGAKRARPFLPAFNYPGVKRLLKYWLFGIGSLSTAVAVLVVAMLVWVDDVEIDVIREKDMAPATSFRPASSDLAKILTAGASIDGTVRLVDGRVRVTVYVQNSKSGLSLWSKSYDKESATILALQTDIAQDLAREIERRTSQTQYLAAGHKNKLSKHQGNL